MSFRIIRTDCQKIISLRTLFLQENNFQIRYNACHERGWSDSYLIECNGEKVGYGAVKGAETLGGRDSIFEFFMIPPFMQRSSIAFEKLLQVVNK